MGMLSDLKTRFARINPDARTARAEAQLAAPLPKPKRKYHDWTVDEQYDYQMKGVIPPDGVKPL